MKALTKEQFEILKQFEPQLDTALNSSFLRGVDKQKFDIIKGIYLDVTDSKEEIKIGCAACVMNLFAKTGVLYFRYKESLKSEVKIEVPVQDIQVKEIVAEKSKKGPKKTIKTKK